MAYAKRAEGRDYSSLNNELAFRFDLRDDHVTARQRLHVIKQNEEESLEDVLTLSIDGYGDAQIATLQQLATGAILRSRKFKDAATLVMNEAPNSIQEACRRVTTAIANKKAQGAAKVSFQECALTFQEENRMASIEKKVDDLVETFHRAIIWITFFVFVGFHPDLRRQGSMIFAKPVRLSPHTYIDISFGLILAKCS